MDLDVVFLGTAGSAPTAARGLPATLVRRGGERLLFDCGEGTQRQLLRSSIGLVDIDALFVTHAHADHFLGIPGMLKTFELRGREAPLTIYGPPWLAPLFDMLQGMVGRTGFSVRYVLLDPNDELRRDGYAIAPFKVLHRSPAVGYALIEDDRPGRFDEEAARRLGVAPGPDFGRLQRGEPVVGANGEVRPDQVLGEARRGRKLVLSGDTAPCDMTLHVAHRADLLVHEATFTEEERERARITKHSTARQAALLAAEAEVKLLALTHLSPRHPAGALRDEAREEFEATIVPRDFDRVDLPLPEKGDPIHVRARDERAPLEHPVPGG
jgi:ribonuclease Z